MHRIITFIAVLILSACAFAHDPGISGLKILLSPDGATVSVTTHLSSLKNLEPKQAVPKELHLIVNGRAWVCENPEVMIDKPTDTVQLQAKIATPVESLEVTDRLFADDPNSKTIVTMMKDGEAVGEAVLTSEFKSWTYGKVTKHSAFQVVKDFLGMGVHHILSGLDHLLFIFALMLARPRIKELVKVATAFTIAHSITLSLCALNIFTLSSRIVEPLIALSIVAVAAEKFFAQNDKVWRTIGIAFFFGLIHGFGFAGALTEAGLPAGQAAWALASFNIGVEVVQISLILIVIPILLWVQKVKPKVYQPGTVACAVLISIAGGFWFVERLFAAANPHHK